MDEVSGPATLPAVPTGAQISLYDLLPEELEAWLAAREQPLFRARQLYAGAYGHVAERAATIPAVPKALGALIDAELPLAILDDVTRTTSADGRTTKLLWRTADGCMIEGVLMHYRDRSTACISSQAGCGYGCTFCATGKMGLTRNLSAGAIVAQVVALARLSESEGHALTNVVYMGMGEPLANYENTLSAIRTLSDPRAFAMSARRITVSTVGLTPMIRRLAGEGLPVGLAVSLHSPDDELRRRLVPTARQTVLEIVAAADAFTAATGRRYTIEYALLDHVNDGLDLANRLATLLRGRPCHVNLIPVNPTANSSTRRPSRDRVLAFERVLALAEINVTVRAEKGIDIAAGCGQLRGEQQGMRPAARPLSIG
jgi:23S rRNA (adenine2503-C2)-methyltransferase